MHIRHQPSRLRCQQQQQQLCCYCYCCHQGSRGSRYCTAADLAAAAAWRWLPASCCCCSRQLQ